MDVIGSIVSVRSNFSEQFASFEEARQFFFTNSGKNKDENKDFSVASKPPLKSNENSTPNMENEPSFWQKNKYIILGAGAFVIGVGVGICFWVVNGSGGNAPTGLEGITDVIQPNALSSDMVGKSAMNIVEEASSQEAGSNISVASFCKEIIQELISAIVRGNGSTNSTGTEESLSSGGSSSSASVGNELSQTSNSEKENEEFSEEKENSEETEASKEEENSKEKEALEEEKKIQVLGELHEYFLQLMPLKKRCEELRLQIKEELKQQKGKVTTEILNKLNELKELTSKMRDISDQMYKLSIKKSSFLNSSKQKDHAIFYSLYRLEIMRNFKIFEIAKSEFIKDETRVVIIEKVDQMIKNLGQKHVCRIWDVSPLMQYFIETKLLKAFDEGFVIDDVLYNETIKKIDSIHLVEQEGSYRVDIVNEFGPSLQLNINQFIEWLSHLLS